MKPRVSRIEGHAGYRDCMFTAAVVAIAAGQEEKTGETELWLAVLVQAIWDAFFSVGMQRQGERVRTEARAWFGSRDFEAVCDLATLDHERVLRMIERLRPIAAARRAARRIADGLRVTTRRTGYKKRGAGHRRQTVKPQPPSSDRICRNAER